MFLVVFNKGRQSSPVHESPETTALNDVDIIRYVTEIAKRVRPLRKYYWIAALSSSASDHSIWPKVSGYAVRKPVEIYSAFGSPLYVNLQDLLSAGVNQVDISVIVRVVTRLDAWEQASGHVCSKDVSWED
ncbi:hypothetical protein SMRU11_08800 (plasmid) [Sinorhizobium meliloti RU11/001]|nr:hypothetical protein SMRU11_08800 [Sinorhizobium meliloti RU11/001]